MAARLLVGLGNPGAEYETTRHNAGFILLDRLAARHQIRWGKCRFADALESTLPSGELLLKPQSFMNLSGPVVQEALHWLKWDREELLVIVDDVALPLGRMRLRVEGSCGGHNGLRSIEQSLGTREYARLRVGVGGAELDGLVGHVLGKFTKTENEKLNETADRAIEAILAARQGGYEAGMRIANQKI